MNDTNQDLIRRGDVMALPHRLSPSLDADDGYFVSVDAVRSLPAVQPVVQPLVWSRGIVDYAKPMPGVKYVACSTTPAGSWAWWLDCAENTREVYKSEEEAKAAAQADYDARVLSALDVQPAPDAAKVAALVNALRSIADGNPTCDSPEADAQNSAAIARAALAAWEDRK